MKIGIRRIVSLVTLTLAMGTALAQEATPALAAGASFYVGTCHNGAFPDLYGAVTAANGLPAAVHKTINVCPGTHTVTIANGALNVMTSNLKIQGRKGAIVTTEAGYSGTTFNVSVGDKVTIQKLTIMAGPGYSGYLVDFSASTNAKILKVVIDGQGNVSAGSVGIMFFNSSGLVSGNKVLNWHSPAYNGSNASTAISATGPGNTVRVTGNTIDSFEGNGIVLQDLASANVTANKISGTYANPTPAGIIAILIGLLTDGRVSGNKITGGTYPAVGNTFGIQVNGSSNIRVTGNKLAHWDTGILIQASCATSPVANDNQIKGNKIQDVAFVGIGVASSGLGCDTHADNLTITGNKILNTAAAGSTGILVAVGNDGSNFGYALNEKIKGNKIVHFLDGVNPALPSPPYVTGVFSPNSFVP